MSASKDSILVIGAGRAGTSVAVAWSRAGRDVTLVCRNDARRRQVLAWLKAEQLALPVVQHPTPEQLLRAGILVFAVPDRLLAQAAADWPHAGAGQTWLHLSGASQPEILLGPHVLAAVGSLHPLCALPEPLRQPASLAGRPLQGALMALAGAPPVLALCQQLAQALGGVPVQVAAEHRVLYHAAAAVVANDLAALVASGETLCAAAGLPPDVARRGLLHLARTSLDALAAVPAQQALVRGLTGAVARGDAVTLSRHLQVLAPWPDVAQLHRDLSLRLVALLEEAAALDASQIAELRAVLDPAQP